MILLQVIDIVIRKSFFMTSYSENVSPSYLSYITNPERRRQIWKFIKVTAAHHPHCDYYRKHYFTIRDVKVCRGCTVYYPTSILSMILVWFIPSSVFERHPNDLLIIGLLFLTPMVIHLSKVDRILHIDRYISLASRISLGLAMGWLIRFFFLVPIVHKIIAMFVVIISMILIQFVRLRTFWGECVSCPYKPYREQYNHCPGLLELNQILNPDIIQYFETFSNIEGLEGDNPKLGSQ